MHMVNVTDLRRNIRGILAEVIRTKEPAMIIQRSKPVAYLVDADTFEMRQGLGESLARSRKESFDKVLRLRSRIAERIGTQGDSTKVIRELREGSNRDE